MIGERVKRIRDARGLSLRDLARDTGVSVPMLSQVERGETSPTLQMATKIAAGLELSLSQLLRLDEEPDVVVVRSDERRTTRRNGHRFAELTPPLPGQRHAVTLHELKPGGVTGRPGDPPLHQAGSRETAVVQQGSLVLVAGHDRFELGIGDAITFDADLQHHFENPGRTQAVFLSVVTAGLRGG